jgi:hypothetical protein
MRRNISILCAALLLTTACQKNSSDNSDPNSITKEHLAGTYKLTSLKANLGGIDQDIMGQALQPCQQDDIYTLKTDLTYTIQDAGTQCSPTDDKSGTWNVPNQTTFVLDSKSYTLDKYDGKNLQVSDTATYNGFTGKVTTIFTKQ